jgi:hypothetical protein
MKLTKTKMMPNGEVREVDFYTCDHCGKSIGNDLVRRSRSQGHYLPHTVVEIAGSHYGKTCAEGIVSAPRPMARPPVDEASSLRKTVLEHVGKKLSDGSWLWLLKLSCGHDEERILGKRQTPYAPPGPKVKCHTCAKRPSS